MALAIVLLVLLGAAPGAVAADGCVDCHTSAAKLQAVVTVPEPAAAEEGEG